MKNSFGKEYFPFSYIGLGFVSFEISYNKTIERLSGSNTAGSVFQGYCWQLMVSSCDFKSLFHLISSLIK